MTRWFDTDTEGMRAQLDDRDRVFAIYELISNSTDTAASKITASLSMPKHGYSLLEVEDDDPTGFPDLKFAYTLFGRTDKRSDPSKSGRFCLGEKKVLCLCKEATIASTKGTVHFERIGGRENRRVTGQKLSRGTKFSGLIQMTPRAYAVACQGTLLVLPKPGTLIAFNGQRLLDRIPVKSFKTKLTTEATDKQGIMRRFLRECEVALYDPLPGEHATLYELGYPVVETGDRWHCDVRQRVPLATDRDNVPPSYLLRIRSEVANAACDLLSEEESGEAWVKEATSGPFISKPAFATIMTKRFGDDKCIVDPSDPDSSKTAHEHGFTPLFGRSLSRGEFENNRKFEAIRSSSEVFPSPRPYSTDPDSPPVDIVPREKWSEGMALVHDYTVALAEKLLGASIRVVFVNTTNEFDACYGELSLDYNIRRLGRKWFERGITEQVDALIIHELGHHRCGRGHLNEEYYQELCRLGARLKQLALDEPEFFKQFRQEEPCPSSHTKP